MFNVRLIVVLMAGLMGFQLMHGAAQRRIEVKVHEDGSVKALRDGQEMPDEMFAFSYEAVMGFACHMVEKRLVEIHRAQILTAGAVIMQRDGQFTVEGSVEVPEVLKAEFSAAIAPDVLRPYMKFADCRGVYFTTAGLSQAGKAAVDLVNRHAGTPINLSFKKDDARP